MQGRISFDTIISDNEDRNNSEGCYRLNDDDWKIFYVTRWWEGEPGIIKDATFSSGIKGSM